MSNVPQKASGRLGGERVRLAACLLVPIWGVGSWGNGMKQQRLPGEVENGEAGRGLYVGLGHLNDLSLSGLEGLGLRSTAGWAR